MTAQALPPSLDQQLADARTATAVAEQKAAHWQGVADTQRKQVDQITAERDAFISERANFDMRLEKARNEIARQREIVDQLALARSAADREVGVLTGERDELARQLAELTQLVGTETPIAAFDLATTWAAEKAAYQEEIADLKEQRDDLLWRARAVYRYVKTYKTTRDGDEARMVVGEALWAAGATDPDKREP